MRQHYLKLGLFGQALFVVSLMVTPKTEVVDQVQKAIEPEIALPEAGETLRVLTLPGILNWREDRTGEVVGIEADLVEQFVQANQWQLEWVVADSRADLYESLRRGEAHMAAAGLAHHAENVTRFNLGASYTEVVDQVACHYKLRPIPDTYEKLQEVEVHVESDSVFEISLRELAQQYEVELDMVSRDDVLTEDLMREVSDREADCLVADSNQLKAMQRVYPDLKVAMNLPKTRKLGWYFPKRAKALTEAANEWMGSEAGQQAVVKVKHDYFDYIAEFDFVEMQVLKRRIRDRLPKYKELFLRAEEKTGIPADLLAAVSYQESHWNPAARSPTGVRGMMMLTRRTAASLGVRNRLDPAESIDGGARYLKNRIERQAEDIPDPDRLFFALASYNVGHAHLLDARQLARTMGRNPASWQDIREILPLKADRRYYRKMRYGYARGHEPVHYVRRIRNYRDVIQLAFKD